MRRYLAGAIGAVALASCGAHAAHRAPAHAAAAYAAPAHASPRHGTPARRAAHRDAIVLVTSERRNELVSVDLRTGRVLARLRVAADPETVVAARWAIVVSAAAHTVTVIDPLTLRVRAQLRRFRTPHIATLAPAAGLAYVSDEAAGTVTPIRLSDAHALPAVRVGLGAHHMALSPDERRLWVALGETARTIVELDVSHPLHPRVVARWRPGFAAHDLAFSSNGTAVWMSRADGPDVVVVDAVSHRVRLRIPVGAAPQHIAFAGSTVYLTSGYAGRIERVAAGTGRILARAATPPGSFELDAGDGYVVTASLFGGAVTAFDPALRRRWSESLGPATRELAIVSGRD